MNLIYNKVSNASQRFSSFNQIPSLLNLFKKFTVIFARKWGWLFTHASKRNLRNISKHKLKKMMTLAQDMFNSVTIG